ncbi:hypothetical protein [Sphingobium sp.]|uniref:hypothetical protein n=1 Tax=Sphingobium sp. TaxID=1912891 RepID=UPI002C44C3D9|nr:hypothetical protein [Sphingobium sp.]HUD94453.1 hypothetical protein [Sphingobium sp.]
MSRVLHASVTPDVLTDLCSKNALRISTLEPLTSGGTRIVMLDGRDADMLRGLLRGKLIEGPVTRSSKYVARQRPA